jgi:hypothetical protein
MPNKFDTSGMIHQWIYVIVPTQEQVFPTLDYQPPTAPIAPLFCAFCKVCRTYFAEPIPWNARYASFGPSSLPRYGCVPPDDVPVI